MKEPQSEGLKLLVSVASSPEWGQSQGHLDVGTGSHLSPHCHEGSVSGLHC